MFCRVFNSYPKVILLFFVYFDQFYPFFLLFVSNLLLLYTFAVIYYLYMYAKKSVTFNDHFRMGFGTTPRSAIPFTESVNGGRLVSVETAIGPAVAVVNGNLPTPSHFFVPGAFSGLTTLPFVSPSTRSILEARVIRSDVIAQSDLVRLTCERSAHPVVSEVRQGLVSYFASNAHLGRFGSIDPSLYGVLRSHVVSNGFAVAFETSGGVSSILFCGSSPIADYAKISSEIGFAQGSGRFVEISADLLRFYRLTLAVFTPPSAALNLLFVPKIKGASIRRIGDDSVDSMQFSDIFNVDSSLLLNPSSRLISVSGYPYPLRSCVLSENSKDEPRYLVVDRQMDDPRIDLIISTLNSKGASIRISDVMECSLSDGSVATFIPLDSLRRPF